MKKPYSVYVLLSVLCVVSSASSWHPLLKRQDQCSARRFCTGFYEEYVYVVAQCNLPETVESIRTTRDFCRVNENGAICSTFDTFMDFEQFTSACGSSLTRTSCSDECRSFLTANRARYGCCVTLFNDTLFLSSDEAVAFSYPLWSRCGVEPVTEECAPSSFVMPAGIDPTCTEEVLIERLTFRVFCRTEFLDDLRNLAVSCGQDVEDLVYPTHCAVDENGKYCSNLDGINSAVYTVSNNCNDTSMCDPLCIQTLTDFTNMFGCCFISELNSTSSVSSYLSYEFWERCSLTSPGFCDLKFDNSPSRISTAVVLKISVQAVLLASAMALILMN